MQYLLFGFMAVCLFLLATRRFAVANPAMLARQLRVGAGVAVMAGAGVLLIRGLAGYAMSLAALGSWLLWGHGGSGWGNFGQRGRVTPGTTSRVATDHLDVELDHDSGAITGRVLKGRFANRELDALRPVELAELWRDCQFEDPQSAQILEAFLDRTHPTWREDHNRTTGAHTDGASGGPSPDTANGRMSPTEAREILGLGPTPTEDDIRRAHRDLMLKMHPDRGGSTYLAAKINEAKDVLLG